MVEDVDLKQQVNQDKLKSVKQMSLFGNSRELQFGTCKPQQATGKSIEALGWAIFRGREGKEGGVQLKVVKIKSERRPALKIPQADKIPAVIQILAHVSGNHKQKFPQVDMRQCLTNCLSLKKILTLSVFSKSGIYETSASQS